MTRQEAVAVTAHDDLVDALVKMRPALIILSFRYGGGTEIDGVPLADIIESADRALAMAGVTFDTSGKATRHAA